MSKSTSTKQSPIFDPSQLMEEFGLGSMGERLRKGVETGAQNYRKASEQWLGFGRQMSEQMSNQLAVSSKLAKDSMDYGINLFDSWTRLAVETTEQAVNNLTADKS